MPLRTALGKVTIYLANGCHQEEKASSPHFSVLKCFHIVNFSCRLFQLGPMVGLNVLQLRATISDVGESTARTRKRCVALCEQHPRLALVYVLAGSPLAVARKALGQSG